MGGANVATSDPSSVYIPPPPVSSPADATTPIGTDAPLDGAETATPAPSDEPMTGLPVSSDPELHNRMSSMEPNDTADTGTLLQRHASDVSQQPQQAQQEALQPNDEPPGALHQLD